MRRRYGSLCVAQASRSSYHAIDFMPELCAHDTISRPTLSVGYCGAHSMYTQYVRRASERDIQRAGLRLSAPACGRDVSVRPFHTYSTMRSRTWIGGHALVSCRESMAPLNVPAEGYASGLREMPRQTDTEGGRTVQYII